MTSDPYTVTDERDPDEDGPHEEHDRELDTLRDEYDASLEREADREYQNWLAEREQHAHWREYANEILELGGSE